MNRVEMLRKRYGYGNASSVGESAKPKPHVNSPEALALHTVLKDGTITSQTGKRVVTQLKIARSFVPPNWPVPAEVKHQLEFDQLVIGE